MTEVVTAATAWRTNGELIAACARLGYITDTDLVLDCTYGRGTWWSVWRPAHLTGCDLDPTKSPIGYSVDFTALPFDDQLFTVVAFDPPYKLNGTPTHAVDERYGVAGAYTNVADRHRLILEGMNECARVLTRDGHLLVKCQDQVNAGRVRWQTDMVTTHALELGLAKVDALLMLGGRPQPVGRTQQHARRNYSTLLIFQRS